jgi:hypothetical protein
MTWGGTMQKIERRWVIVWHMVMIILSAMTVSPDLPGSDVENPPLTTFCESTGLVYSPSS